MVQKVAFLYHDLALIEDSLRPEEVLHLLDTMVAAAARSVDSFTQFN
jgi:hypothetical protein|eukprot:COSAG06_NODE_38230_length_425_cov_35.837423_1_plen_47_part_01